MTAYPCAGCGRVVVVAHVLCVDCESTLRSAPIIPRRLTLDPGDSPTSVIDATLLLDGPGA